MAYSIEVAAQVRAYLTGIRGIQVTEKKMFGGLAFLVNDKMCVNVSGGDLMCRFDPDQMAAVAQRRGYRPMIMKGKKLPGYCYVAPEGFADPDDFSDWLELCLAFNEAAKKSTKRIT